MPARPAHHHDGRPTMNRTTWLLPLVVAVLLGGLTACGDDEELPAREAPAGRQEAIASLQNALDHIDRQLEKLEIDLGQVTDATRQEFQETYGDLRTRRAELRGRLDALQQESGEQWQQMHVEVKNALEELSTRVDRLSRDLNAPQDE